MSGVDTRAFTPRERLESDAEGIIRQFYMGIAWSASCVESLLPAASLTVTGDDRPDAWRRTVTTRVRALLSSTKKYEILAKSVAPIAGYFNTNGGFSKTGDPYKLAYWYGIELAKELNKVSAHDAMVALVATIELLNHFLLATKGKKPSMNREMIGKIQKSIAEERWEKDFGAYGIYFAFKSLAKAESQIPPQLSQ
jgi:hypothetical protein